MNLKIWSELLSGMLAFALGFLPGIWILTGNLPVCLYFQAHALPVLIGCFIAGLALWLPVKNGWTDKIFLRRRPLTLTEPGGIALYSKRRRKIIFHGFFKEPREMMKKISLLDLFFRYSALPIIVVKKEIREKIFDNPEIPSCELGVKYVRFIFIPGSDPLKVFATHQSKAATGKFLAAAVSQALQETGESLLISRDSTITPNNLKNIFLSRLNELLAGKYYKVDGDFKFLTIIQK